MQSGSRREIGDVRINLAIVLLLLGLNALIFIVLPLWLLPASIHFAWLLVPLVPLSVTHWATIHEAIHGSLHPDRRVNDRIGRLLAIGFGSPYELLRFGHLSHHALNGAEPERPDLLDGGRTGPAAGLVYYVRLLVGLYAAELASTLLCLLPRRLLRPLVRKIFYDADPRARNMADRAERQLLDRRRLGETRRDALSILALFGLAFWLYGAAWPLLVLVLLGRAFLVSFMDNAPHYGGATGDPAQGYDMAVPPALGRLILNSNLHGTHHRHPNTPWQALPRAFEVDGSRFAGSYLTIPWRQLRGPIVVRGDASAGHAPEAVGRAP